MTAKTIALIGEVSSSKSSFLNALTGGFISSVSLQRETFQPLSYKFNKTTDRKNIIAATSELSEIHKQNMAKREALSKNIGNMENEMTQLKPVKYDLPMLHDIDNINIIDFPGFNDSDDKNSVFLKALQNESTLKSIDMIIYVTDSTRAFVSASEVKLFTDIKNIVTEEEKKCHYMDLIVLVNKYDNILDEDLHQIYGRIQQKIEIPANKIFRASNHKMMIHALRRGNHALCVPDFLAKTEIKKIIQNANCMVTKNTSTDSGYVLLKSQDIQVGDLSDNLVAGQMPKLIGDWDDLIGYLSRFSVTHTKAILVMMETKMKCWVKECEPLNAEYKKFSINESLECQLLETMIRYHQILIKYDPSHTIFNKYIMELLESILKTDKKIRPIILENIFQYQPSCRIIEQIINIIIKKSDMIATETLIVIFYHKITNGHIILTVDPFWIKKIFSESVTYAPTFKFYNLNQKSWVTECDKIPSSQHPSWFINKLMYIGTLPKQFKQLLLLTVLPIDTLKMFLSQNMIDDSILSTIDPDLPIKFRYLVQINPDNRKMLEHHLFGSNQGAGIEYINKHKYWIQLSNK